MKKKESRTIRIGCDLDGVVAKHSLGGFWVKVRLLKEKFLKKVHSPTYYYPRTFLERQAWKFINSLRIPDKEGISSLKKGQDSGESFFLITSRFKFNYQTTIKWLKKYNLFPLFDEILVNIEDENPIDFKAEKVKSRRITYFVDDDLEVLLALRKTKAKLYWVVPGHKDGQENHGSGIVNCKNLSEALKKIKKDQE